MVSSNIQMVKNPIFSIYNIPSDEIRFLQHKLISKNSINLISCYMFVCQHFTAGLRILLNIHTIFELKLWRKVSSTRFL